jgi:hypothetical protein
MPAVVNVTRDEATPARTGRLCLSAERRVGTIEVVSPDHRTALPKAEEPPFFKSGFKNK